MVASLLRDNMFRGMFLMEDIFDPIRSRARRVIRLTGLSDDKSALIQAKAWVLANDAGSYDSIPLHNVSAFPINHTDARVVLDYADEPNYYLGVTPTQADETIWGVGTFPVPWINSMATWTSGRPAGTELNGSSDLDNENRQPIPYIWHVPVVTIAIPALISGNANDDEASRLQKINSDGVTSGGIAYSAKQLLYTGATINLKKNGLFPTYYNFLAREDTWQKQITSWSGTAWTAATVDMYDATTFSGNFPAS